MVLKKKIMLVTSIFSFFHYFLFWFHRDKTYHAHCTYLCYKNSIQQFLNLSKLKALANNKIQVTEKLKHLLGRVKNTFGKGENAVYHHFPFSHSVFKRILFSIMSKVGNVLKIDFIEESQIVEKTTIAHYIQEVLFH